MKEIDIKELELNPCLRIGDEWMLVSAGNKKGWNTMTASWGEMGALWGNGLKGKGTFTVFIRPSRYTDKFVDENDCFSVSFFPCEYHDDLLYLGSHSGRDEDKITKTKLTPLLEKEAPIFKEASLTIICRKLYKGEIEKDGFIEKSILDHYYKSGNGIYNNDEFHNVYVGKILQIFVK